MSSSQNEPLEEDLKLYAQFLGIDPEKDAELMTIVKEGIAAPIPNNFLVYTTDNGELYYYNIQTKQTSWDHPLDEQYRARALEELKKKYSSEDVAKKQQNITNISNKLKFRRSKLIKDVPIDSNTIHNQFENLQQAITKAKQELEKINNKIKVKQKMLDNLNKQIDDAQKTLSTTKTSISELNAKKQSLTKEIQNLEQQYHKNEKPTSTTSTTYQELEKIDKKIKVKQKILDSLNKQIDEAQQSLSNTKTSINELEEKKKLLLTEIQNMEQQDRTNETQPQLTSSASQELEKINKKIKVKQKILDNLNKQIDEAQHTLSATKTSINELDEKKQSLITEIQNIEQQNCKNEIQTQVTSSTHSEKYEENSKLSESLHELKKQIVIEESKIKEIKKQYSYEETKLSTLKTIVNRQTAEYENLKKQRELELKQYQEKFENLQHQIEQMNEEKSKKEKELYTIENALTYKKETEAANIDSLILSKQLELEDKIKNIEKLKADELMLKNCIEEKNIRLQEVAINLEQQELELKQHQEKFENLQHQIEKMNDELSTKENDIKHKQIELDGIINIISQKKLELEHLNTQYEQDNYEVSRKHNELRNKSPQSERIITDYKNQLAKKDELINDYKIQLLKRDEELQSLKKQIDVLNELLLKNKSPSPIKDDSKEQSFTSPKTPDPNSSRNSENTNSTMSDILTDESIILNENEKLKQSIVTKQEVISQLDKKNASLANELEQLTKALITQPDNLPTDTFSKEQTYSNWRENCLQELEQEKEKIKAVRQMIKVESTTIEEKYKLLEKATEEWKNDMKLARENPELNDLVLNNAKTILEQQVKIVNDESEQLARMHKMLLIRREKIKLLQKLLENTNDLSKFLNTSDDGETMKKEKKRRLKREFQASLFTTKRIQRLDVELFRLWAAVEIHSSYKQMEDISWKQPSLLSRSHSPVHKKWKKYFKETRDISKMTRLGEVQQLLRNWVGSTGFEKVILNQHSKWLEAFHTQLKSFK